MGITAKSRASLALRGTTSLSAEEVKSVIQDVAKATKGGRGSLLTTGLANIGAHVSIARDSGEKVALALTSGKKLVELCTFSATVSANGAGTKVRVGGLETYKTNQEKLLFFIPVGPKMIMGMGPYKAFLNGLADEIRARDSSASVTVEQTA